MPDKQTLTVERSEKWAHEKMSQTQQRILKQFVNIPYSKSPVQRWYGDMAATIYYGLKF